MGTFVVIAVLVGVVTLAVRSLWKNRRDRGCCNSGCGNCRGCR